MLIILRRIWCKNKSFILVVRVALYTPVVLEAGFFRGTVPDSISLVFNIFVIYLSGDNVTVNVKKMFGWK